MCTTYFDSKSVGIVPRILFMFVRFLQYTSFISLNTINKLVIVTDTGCVLCEARSEMLCIIEINTWLQIVKFSCSLKYATQLSGGIYVASTDRDQNMLSCGDCGGIWKEELLTCLMACLISHMQTEGKHDKSQYNQFLAAIRVYILLHSTRLASWRIVQPTQRLRSGLDEWGSGGSVSYGSILLYVLCSILALIEVSSLN